MYEIDGMSFRKYCLLHGLNYYSIYDRMLDKCETPKEAMKNIKPIIKYNGKTRKQICTENKISYSKLCRLMQNGLSFEEAFKKTKADA